MKATDLVVAVDQSSNFDLYMRQHVVTVASRKSQMPHIPALGTTADNHGEHRFPTYPGQSHL